MGRPRKYEEPLTTTAFRMSDEQRRRLFKLAELWEVSAAEVVRNLVDEMYEKAVGE